MPLSVAGIIVGTGLAGFYGTKNWILFALALLTAIGFQITSNLANDYGDGVKGTDNADRIGPKRMLQSGLLSRKELKIGIWLSSMINLGLVILVVSLAFNRSEMVYPIVFLGLGTLCIWAAIKYTVGTSAYGYRGLGDVFVFLFFGVLAVLGSMFLYTKFLTKQAILPACAMGFLSTAVLNLNNLRDHESDKKAGKNTMIVRMGFQNGKYYHNLLVLSGLLTFSTFVLMNSKEWYQFGCLAALIPIALHMRKVYTIKQPALLDPELKKLALGTFAMAVVFFIGFN